MSDVFELPFEMLDHLQADSDIREYLYMERCLGYTTET